VICALTARRLTSGAFDAFRAASDDRHMHSDGIRRWTRIHHVRDVTDPDVTVSFGLFDGTLEELRETQASIGGNGVDATEQHVAAVLLDGSFEVVEEIVPPRG
jgi:hypothetical protein